MRYTLRYTRLYCNAIESCDGRMGLYLVELLVFGFRFPLIRLLIVIPSKNLPCGYGTYG